MSISHTSRSQLEISDDTIATGGSGSDELSSESPETTANENANKLSNRLVAEICDFGLYKDEQLVSYLNKKYHQIMEHPKIVNNSLIKEKFHTVFKNICDEFQVQFDSLDLNIMKPSKQTQNDSDSKHTSKKQPQES